MYERMFLTKNENWKAFTQPGEKIKIGFLSTDEKRRVLVELIEVSGKKVKAELRIYQAQDLPDPKNFNFLISIEEAEDLLKICQDPILSYTKYLFGIRSNIYTLSDTQIWYVKEYEGPHKGFIISGVELHTAADTLFPPNWIGAEITNDPKYQDINILTCTLTPIQQVLGRVII